MIKIALTGGIGTGKTYISRYFVERNVPVFNADEEAKKLYKASEVLDFVEHLFGKTVIRDGEIDFLKVAAIVFQNADLLNRLNGFIHPLVMKQFEQWATFQTSQIVAMESAIIFEAQFESFFDFVIVVDAPLPLRIERIKQRNPSLTNQEIQQRIDNQIDQSVKCQKADFVIMNDEQHDISAQIDDFFLKIEPE